MKSKLTPILTTALLSFYLSQCASTSIQRPVQTVVTSPDTVLSVSFLHWNDLHSANLPYVSNWGYTKGQMIGGYATMAGYIDSLKRIYPEAVVLNAGDDFQGSPISALTKGMSQIRILNEIKPDAFTIGNHEFDYSMDNLRRAVATANFAVLSCNIFDSTRMTLFTEPYKIVQSRGVRIGIIGGIMENLKSTVLPSNMEKIAILDLSASIMKYVAEIQDKTDLIVVLSHNGFREDSLLATRINAVDVIFGGHSHTRLKQPVPVNNILICQAGSRGQFLGHLRAVVMPQSGRIIRYEYELIETVVKNITPSAAVAHIVDSLEAGIETEMNRIIGELKTDWVRSSRGESNIGNWIADAICHHFKADIAFQNSGGIRKGLNAGPIRVRDIWEISPFDNTIVLVTVTGEQLLQILNWRIQHPRDLLQQSGIRRVYDGVSKTLLEASVNGEPIDLQQKYVIATNNYIVGHIDRFFGLSAEDVEIHDTGIIGRDVLIQTVEEQPIVDSRTDGRLIIRNR
ncbi:MAG TPA: bifunctional metallophosphatase/5'-nucleotidase [Candidatus Marinimicrobia bacterium]|nr:bifunctional metallophosphatase/5'-nucleotidase [Candidatus Neomarinimicrobiota bacterium]